MVLADSFYYQPVQIDTINTRVNADLLQKRVTLTGAVWLYRLQKMEQLKTLPELHCVYSGVIYRLGLAGSQTSKLSMRPRVYKLVYPTSMLHRGRVEAFIRITDNGILSGTRNLMITVERMVGSDETIEAQMTFRHFKQRY